MLTIAGSHTIILTVIEHLVYNILYMINITLDTNCIIDLEENRANAIYIEKLIRLNEERKINLSVPGISASERKSNNEYASNFTEFQQKIALIGLGNINILKPMGRWGMAFWDWCIYADKQMIDLERKIHQILFPTIEFTLSGALNKQWRNAKCDVLAMWCHIYYKGDLFVTADGNFHKETKKPKLITLGAGDILKPEDVIVRLKCIVI